MRVIEHGNLFEKGPIMCPECGCKFVYDAKDIKDSDVQMNGLTMTAVTATPFLICPECRQKIIIVEER